MNKQFTILAVFFSIILAWARLSQAAVIPITEEFTLKNGLKVILQKDHRAPIVEIQIWYKVGSSDEPPGLTGVSHALEHMMFKGTKKIEPDQYAKIIADIGGKHNAATSYDFTVYHQTVPKHALNLVLTLEADRMENLNLTESEFASELKVIQEERLLRTDDDPIAATRERYLATAHLPASYSQPVIGWMEDIKSLTVEDLKYWYKKWYAPNNATLVIVGDISIKETKTLIAKTFKKIPQRKLLPRKSIPRVKPPGLRRINVSLPAELPIIFMGINTPSLSTSEDPWEAYALALLANILESSSYTLYKELVREKQIASSIYVYYDDLKRGDGLFNISAIPNIQKNHTNKDLEKAILEHLKKLQKSLLNEQDLIKAKTQFIAKATYKFDNIYEQAWLLGKLETAGLPWNISQQYINSIKEISAEQIQSVAKKYFNATNMTIAHLEPVKTKTKTQQTMEKAQSEK